jgi:DNA-binding transcriptional ArsR family regulator
MRTEAVLRALAEPRRQAILKLVRDTPRSVTEIGEYFEISQQAVSQHLQVLAEAGLVTVQPAGRQRLYVVDPRGLEHLEHFLAELWPKGLDRLKAAVEKRAGRRRGE